MIVIDSLSHAWTGKDGALELKDRAAARSKSNDSFGAWREVTPLHNRLVDSIVGAGLHVIYTMRSKVEYVVEHDEKGHTQVRKVGTQPVPRDGVGYEFDVVGDLGQDNTLVITKSRCPLLAGAVIPRPGKEMADTLQEWLESGVSSEASSDTRVRKPLRQEANVQRPQLSEPQRQQQGPERPITAAQLSLAGRLLRDMGDLDHHQEALLLEYRFGAGVVSRRELTMQQASELISWLRKGGSTEARSFMQSQQDHRVLTT